MGKSKALMERWSRRYDWPGRVTAYGAYVARVERDAIQDALKSARGNRAKAARLLATTGRIFNYKVRGYGIDWRRFRS